MASFEWGGGGGWPICRGVAAVYAVELLQLPNEHARIPRLFRSAVAHTCRVGYCKNPVFGSIHSNPGLDLLDAQTRALRAAEDGWRKNKTLPARMGEYRRRAGLESFRQAQNRSSAHTGDP